MKKDLIIAAGETGQLNTFIQAIKESGLLDTLKHAGPFTIFAPTDDAFAKIPQVTLENLFKRPDQLATILSHHILPGVFLAEQLTQLSYPKTVEGHPIKIHMMRGMLHFGPSEIIRTDITADNGVIHLIDTVVLSHK